MNNLTPNATPSNALPAVAATAGSDAKADVQNTPAPVKAPLKKAAPAAVPAKAVKAAPAKAAVPAKAMKAVKVAKPTKVVKASTPVATPAVKPVAKAATKAAVKTGKPVKAPKVATVATVGKVAKVEKPVKPVKPIKALKAAKPMKPAKPPKAAAVATPEAGVAKLQRRQEKLVRDSFTMPRADFELIAALKDRALGFKQPVKKSELLRAGLQALNALSDSALQTLLAKLPQLKTGRPKKAE